MEHFELLDIVRRPLSPDSRLEVPASREEYERVEEILEREEAKYPQLWYDGMRSVAIVVAPPTPLHAGMASGLLSVISDEVKMNSGISSEIARGLRIESDSRTTMNNTTRASDGALLYWEGDRATLMIAVEVAVSQSNDSMRAAISWSVCALHCSLGLAMCIREESRGRRPPRRHYASLDEANAAVDEARDDFYHQLVQNPYGPLERDGVTWFGRVRLVVLETFRRQDEHCTPETLLQPSKSFTLVENGEYIAQNISPNLQEVVLGDCIPTHLLNNQHMEATPVNFFQREWFETLFRGSIVRTAILRVWENTSYVQSVA
ncbi:hypothetical protein POJ06DRAFT_234516 [Lipomyces tetrasporus]|uniref:Uncharacterized protein n=1 Tax=Lipomyces tetrasporus TaxID=54092 RepID=A0AAD7VW03_9ASCO|nr:uncharacterized protein POJ06DRAFT_234516 [Lipomyces tetrasporus]KAJ8103509.1 hypothetical protein POJ06DRAFT_234516 [Lipomyces tetrasporus]